MLGQAIEGVASERCETVKRALHKVVTAFPPKSTGRQRVVSLAASVMDRKQLAKTLMMSPRYISTCVRVVSNPGSVITKASPNTEDAGETTRGGEVVSYGKKHGQQYSQIRGIEGELIIQFIFSHASSKSGQKERTTGWVTLTTEMSLGRLYERYRVELFSAYLMEAHQDPQYATGEIPAKITKHQANCWHALWRSKQPGFDLTDVCIERVTECRQERMTKGAASALRGEGRPKLTGSAFDPAKWVIVPRKWTSVTKFLGIQKIKVRSKTDPKNCPICEEGVGLEKRIERLRHKIGGMDDNLDRLVLQNELKTLEKKLARYNKHTLSLAKQRAKVRKLIEKTKRDPTRALMYMDFISWYAKCSAKIRDLVFVLIRGGVNTNIHNIHWGDGAGCDTYFVVDALTHLFKNTSFLDKILKLHVVSDRGPCFSNPRLWYFESKVHDLIMEWRENRTAPLALKRVFFTEYHGESSADGVGNGAKCAYNWWSLEGQATGWPNGAKELTDMLNMGFLSQFHAKTHSRTVAYGFETINYGLTVFAECDGTPKSGPNKNAVKHLRQKAGEVRYSWLKDGVHERLHGVVRIREVCGEGPWTFVDTLHSGSSERGAMCVRCTGVKDFPVYHRGASCVVEEDAPIEDRDRVQPCTDRIEENQVPRKKGTVSKKKKEEQYDCLTVPELKEFLRSRGMSVSGNRATLLARARALGDGAAPEVAEGGGEGQEESQEEDESRGELEDESDGEQYTILDITAWRKIGDKNPQEQFLVTWADEPASWCTHAQLLFEWPLASPYCDEEFLANKLEDVKTNKTAQMDKGARRRAERESRALRRAPRAPLR